MRAGAAPEDGAGAAPEDGAGAAPEEGAGAVRRSTRCSRVSSGDSHSLLSVRGGEESFKKVT
jgi:hypothetical protein